MQRNCRYLGSYPVLNLLHERSIDVDNVAVTVGAARHVAADRCGPPVPARRLVTTALAARVPVVVIIDHGRPRPGFSRLATPFDERRLAI